MRTGNVFKVLFEALFEAYAESTLSTKNRIFQKKERNYEITTNNS
jgi:hypothetical protein